MSSIPPDDQLDIKNNISSLKEIINNKNCVENVLENLQSFLSDSNLRSIPINILNEHIFYTAVSYAQEKFYEVIKNINENYNNKKTIDFESDKYLFNTLVNLLKCWDLCINHISVLEKICIIDIKNFPSSLFEVMIETLSYCKIWAKDFGEQSTSVTSFLTSIFHQCINTLNSFYYILDSVILFDKEEKNEMEILFQIIDNWGKLAKLVTDTDFKTLMDMWKYFGKLSIEYCLEVKSISPNLITYHFKELAKSVISVLKYINQQSSSNERPIFCCRVLIKILEKLLDTFYGWIQRNVMCEIIIMIANLYMYTEHNLGISGYNAEFVKFIASNFTVVIEPFLDVAFKNDSFKMSLFDCEKNVNDNAIGYHLLLLRIIKKISILPSIEQREWYNKEQCILDACFQSINRLTKDICVGKLQIQISRNVAQGSYMTNIYEATCLNIFALVCQFSTSDFSQLIMLLLKYLLNGKFFSSLLSSDVWCFISRLSSSETCYSLFKYLTHIYEMLTERKNNFNVVMLYNLIGRQYNFLLDTDKIDFINNLVKMSYYNDWSPIIQMMDTEKKNCLQAEIDVSTLNNRILANLRTLENQPTLDNLSLLLKDLSIIETCDVPQNEQLADIFIIMWNKIVYILSDCEGSVLLLLENFTTSLLRATHPESYQIKYMTSILESMMMMYPYASTGLRLEFCRFFYRFAENFNDCHKSVVADLMYRMLSDDDPSIHQQAFESFEQLTLVCQSINVLSTVALTVKNSQNDLSNALSDYIGGQIVNTIDLDNFFINLSNYSLERLKHVCHVRTQMNWEKIPKLSEPVSELENVEKQVNKVCADMELILKLKKCLKKDTCDRLRKLCQKFLDQSD